jgi:DNA-binding CsgD family transcriptional regulator
MSGGELSCISHLRVGDDPSWSISKATLDEKPTTQRVWQREIDPRADRLVLEVVRGRERGRVLEVTQGEHVLGRGPGADLKIEDSGVSRRHARLVRSSHGVYNLIDLRSTNGTGINGRPVDVAVLRPGDRVQLGPDVELRFGPSEPVEAEPAAEARRRAAEQIRRKLTARQLQVAKLVAEGLGNREVAERLGLRDRTVESHLDHIYTQLELGSRSALTRVIVEAGLLP